MTGGATQVLTFRVGDQRLALPMSVVSEVAARPPLTRVPGAPPALAGLASHRGEVLPVLATGALVGVSTAQAQGSRLIILDRVPPLGLAVDEVTGLAALDGGAADRGGLMLLDDGEARMMAIDDLLNARFSGINVRPAAQGGAQREVRAQPTRQTQLTFLGVRLGDQAYALPLNVVAEVLPVPDEIPRLPRTDAAMLGVMAVRGRLLPVVSTQVLLGLDRTERGSEARVVVVTIGLSRVGLLVDAVRTIVRVADDRVGRVPRVLNRGAGEGRVEAMLREPGGGLVAILAPERLFREDSVARILEDGRLEGDETREAVVEHGEKLLVFTLGSERYAIPLAAVQEVVNSPATLTRVPNAPAFLAGVMNLRGEVLPVVDQRERFQAVEADAGRRRVIVTRLDGVLCGFAVDEVSAILEVSASDIALTPSIVADGATLFDRTARVGHDGAVVLIVDPKALLDQAEAELMRRAVEAGEPTPK